MCDLEFSYVNLIAADVRDRALHAIWWSARADGTEQMGQDGGIRCSSEHTRYKIHLEMPPMSADRPLVGLTFRMLGQRADSLFYDMASATALLWKGQPTADELHDGLSYVDKSNSLHTLCEQATCDLDMCMRVADCVPAPGVLFSWDTPALPVAQLTCALTMTDDARARCSGVLAGGSHPGLCAILKADVECIRQVRQGTSDAYKHTAGVCSSNASGFSCWEILKAATVRNAYTHTAPETNGIDEASAYVSYTDKSWRYPAVVLDAAMRATVPMTGGPLLPVDDMIGIVGTVCCRFAIASPYAPDVSLDARGAWQPSDYLCDPVMRCSFSVHLGYLTNMCASDCEDMAVQVETVFNAIRSYTGAEFPLLARAAQAARAYVACILTITCSSPNPSILDTTTEMTHCVTVLIPNELHRKWQGQAVTADPLVGVVLCEGTCPVSDHGRACTHPVRQMKTRANFTARDTAMAHVARHDPLRLLVPQPYCPGGFYLNVVQVKKNVTTNDTK